MRGTRSDPSPVGSARMNLPIGAVVCNAEAGAGSCEGRLLDGQRKVTALTEYVGGLFPVGGYSFYEPEPSQQSELLASAVSAIESQASDHDLCIDIHDRLVYDATATSRSQKD